MPTVDIFIPTYNESENILRKTIAGAININYPKDLVTIYLCDDGRRENIKKISDEFNINYLTRSDNEHAKAGNINNAIKNSKSELFVILDADMIAKEDFLLKTIPYFIEEKVGFVQTPQVFYNPDPFQYNLYFNENIPNEQDFFMRDIQQGRARHNAVLHVGTNAVFRRQAIMEIGGILTGTITEDMATGMLLQSKGYEGIFLNEVLVLGLSVETFSDLVKQRERWCRGNIQVVKKWNPLTLKGLNFFQRLLYMDGFVYWFFGVQKMIYILCPLVYLIFGIVILEAKALDIFYIFTPSLVASILTFRCLVKKERTLTWSHIYETAMAPYLGLAALMELIFARPIPFKVTPKGVQTNKVYMSWNVVIPQIILLILSIIGWSVAINRNISNSNYINSLMINVVWSVYNVIGIIMSIFVCIERPRFRTSERFTFSDEVIVKLKDGTSSKCKIIDISSEGFLMLCNKEEINVKELDKIIDLRINTLNIEAMGEIKWINESQNKAGVKLIINDLTTYRAIIKYIFKSYEGYYNTNNSKSSFLKALKEVVRSIFTNIKAK